MSDVGNQPYPSSYGDRRTSPGARPSNSDDIPQRPVTSENGRGSPGGYINNFYPRLQRDPCLPGKTQELIKKGLPWPGRKEIVHDLRALVQKSVPWHEEKDTMDDYDIVKNLGTGGFAKVFVGCHKESGEEVAIKRILMENEADREIVYKEIKHLTMMRDMKHVVTIYSIYEHQDTIDIVMELCKGGELHVGFGQTGEDGKKRKYTYGDVAGIAMCMLRLVAALHANGIVHCDLKLENFCLSEPLTDDQDIGDLLRLIDFGLSQRVRGGQAIAGFAGSVPYMAPEVRTSRMYNNKVDIWSTGVILYTLLLGRLPFDGSTAEAIIGRAATHQPDLTGIHPAVADFIRLLLTKDPKRRPDAEEALGHPWLRASSGAKVQGLDQEQIQDAQMQTVSDEVAMNLARFAAGNKLQRAFMYLAVVFMNESEMQKIMKQFSQLTTNDNQQLNADQISKMLVHGRTEEEAKQIRATVEKVMGKDGTPLSAHEFVVATMNQYRNLSDQVIQSMFKHMDTDEDGWITAHDAHRALVPTGIHITEQELERLFATHTKRKRLGEAAKEVGIMFYDEFRNLMLSSVSQRLTNDLDTVMTAFEANREQTVIQKLVLRIIAENAPANSEVERIRNAFRKLDTQGSGMLTKEQLQRGVKEAGYMVSKDDMDRLFADLDDDGTQYVRYHEFVANALDRNLLVGDNLLQWVFDYMDDDDSTTITAENLEKLLDFVDWSEVQKRKIWDELSDENGEYQELTFQEFKELIQGEGGRNLLRRMAHVRATADNPDLVEAENQPQLSQNFSANDLSRLSSSGDQDFQSASSLGGRIASMAPSSTFLGTVEEHSASAPAHVWQRWQNEGANDSDDEHETSLFRGRSQANAGSSAASLRDSLQIVSPPPRVRHAKPPATPTELPRARSSPGAGLPAAGAALAGEQPSASPRTAAGDGASTASVTDPSPRDKEEWSKEQLWKQKSYAAKKPKNVFSKLKDKFRKKRG